MHTIIYGNIPDVIKKNITLYESKFKLIYLDPPYNSKRNRGARKLYTDSKKNWGDFIKTTIEYSYKLLKDDGFLAVSINQMELFNLKNIIDEVFDSEKLIGLFPVKIRHKDRQLMINATYHDVYEYLLIYRKNKGTRFYYQHKPPKLDKFIYDVQILDNNCRTEMINGKKVEIYTSEQYKIVKVEPNLEALRRYIIAGKLKTANWSGEWYENHLKNIGNDYLFKVYGLEQEGLGYRWFHSGNSRRKSGVYFQSSLTAGRPILPTNDLDFTDEVTNIYKEGGEGCDYKDSKKPEKLLSWLLEICTRSGDEVLDMFGGSGTTLATCIKNNRVCTIIDNNQDAIKIIKNRLNNLCEGNDIDNIKYKFEYRFLNIYEEG